jgi:SH3-like domain-containing protein
MGGTSTALRIVAITAIAVVSSAAAFAALSFPRVITEFPVSFTIGFEREQRAFEVPWLHDKSQVEVAINNGSSLWRASITNADGEEIWAHSAVQGEQTSYHSEWILLPSSRYNFTFSTIGIGSLEANIKIVSKGGIW